MTVRVWVTVGGWVYVGGLALRWTGAVASQENPMPDMHLYFAFVLAVTILMLIPGPNVALIVANSVAYGPRFGLLTVAGTSSAMVLQLALTVLGMTELLGTLGTWFEWIRWIGVAYLI